MKYYTLILALIVVAIVSCSKDQCPTEDYVGTYVGDRVCGGTNSMDNDTVVISRLGDDRLSIAIFTYSLETTIDGCDLEVDDSTILGQGRTGTASLNGTTLTVSYQTTALGVIIEECEFIGEIQ